jgi:homopolymeric O-antigen transport system permease protein
MPTAGCRNYGKWCLAYSRLGQPFVVWSGEWLVSRNESVGVPIEIEGAPFSGSPNAGSLRHVSKPLSVIRPRTKALTVDWTGIWHSRELLYFLVWRDILIRYKQTVLGALWEILKPLSMMIVLTVCLGYMMKVSSGGIPYPLFYYSGMLVWTFFAQAMAATSSSVLGASNLVTKVYFPRVIIPIGVVLSNLFDFVIAFGLMIFLMLYYKAFSLCGFLVLPCVVVIVMMTALGVGLFFAAIIVKYRDFQNIIPVLITIWMFLTPVFYPASLVPERWRLFYCANPMASAVSLFRWGFLGEHAVPLPYLVPGAVVACLLLVGGFIYFQIAERTFSDWL